jgi:HEAT repeat protein
VSVVGPVLVAAVVLLVLAAMASNAIHRALRRQSQANAPVSSSGASISNAGNPSGVPAPSSEGTIAAVAQPSPAVGTISAKEPFSAAGDVSELDDIMEGNRPENERLGVALASLDSPDKKVRRAALEAVRGLDDRDAVPRLEDLASRTEDPEEKAALIEVADFLNLPSMTEFAAAHPGTGKAATNRIQRAANFRKKATAMPAQTQPAGQP